ncbi:MAG: thioredoxin family protein [Chthoniobacterales bacterium]
MKHLIFSALAAATLAGIASAQTQAQWLTDFKKAQEQAKTTNKPLLIEFTGSDWCPPCRMLQKEVLSTREFQEYASKNLVLLEIDFPRAKPQNAELAQQNQTLAQRFGIDGFPSIILLNADGKKLGQLVGYDPHAGRQGYIDALEKMRKS